MFKLSHLPKTLISSKKTALRNTWITIRNFTDNQDEKLIKTNILNSSLNHVQQYGWSRDALVAGAKDQGYPAITHGLFDKGPVELVYHHYSSSNAKLLQHLKERECGNKKEFIAHAIEERLKMQLPYIEQWPQAMAMLSLPWNAKESLTLLQELMNDIWYSTGDKTVDMNWYTKRIMLAAVYKSSELYMLNSVKSSNEEAEMDDTREFINRRLDDVMSFGKFTSKLQNKASSDEINNLITGIFQVGKNVLSMNDRKR